MSKFFEWCANEAPIFTMATVFLSVIGSAIALLLTSIFLLFYGFWLHIPIILALPIICAYREYKRATEQGH